MATMNERMYVTVYRVLVFFIFLIKARPMVLNYCFNKISSYSQTYYGVGSTHTVYMLLLLLYYTYKITFQNIYLGLGKKTNFINLHRPIYFEFSILNLSGDFGLLI